MTKARKYSAYLFTIVLAALLVFQGGINGEEFAGLVKVAITAFVLGNSAEHYLSK